jgi:hypothetical protein
MYFKNINTYSPLHACMHCNQNQEYSSWNAKRLRTYSSFTTYFFERQIVSFVEHQKYQGLKQRHLKVFDVIL